MNFDNIERFIPSQLQGFKVLERLLRLTIPTNLHSSDKTRFSSPNKFSRIFKGHRHFGFTFGASFRSNGPGLSLCQHFSQLIAKKSPTCAFTHPSTPFFRASSYPLDIDLVSRSNQLSELFSPLCDGTAPFDGTPFEGERNAKIEIDENSCTWFRSNLSSH